jgi:hypothetical protein
MESSNVAPVSGSPSSPTLVQVTMPLVLLTIVSSWRLAWAVMTTCRSAARA